MSRISRFHYVALTALVALAIDLTTKSLAVQHLSKHHITDFGPVRLRLVFNLGNTVHPYHSSLANLLETRLLTAALLVGILFVLKSRVAAVGLGLLFAALLGNFLNLALSPHQVPDFLLLGLAFNRVWTANLADFWAFFGVLTISCSIAMRCVQLLRSVEAKRPSPVEEVPAEQFV